MWHMLGLTKTETPTSRFCRSGSLVYLASAVSAAKATAIEQRRRHPVVMSSPQDPSPSLTSELSLLLSTTHPPTHPSSSQVAHHSIAVPYITLTVIVLNHTTCNHEGHTFRRGVAAGLSERWRPQDAVEEGLSIGAACWGQHRYSRQAPRSEVHGCPTSVAR